MQMDFSAGIIVPPDATVKQPYINTAVFRMADGSIKVIDRERTEYTFTVSHLYMTWCDIYVWDGDGATYINDPSFFEGAQCVGFVMEEDEFIPSGYHVIPQTCECGGVEVTCPSREGDRLITAGQVFDLMQKKEHWDFEVFDRTGNHHLSHANSLGWRGNKEVLGMPVMKITPSITGLSLRVFEPIDDDGASLIPDLPPHWEEVKDDE